MSTSKIKQTNSCYSSAEKQAVNGGNRFVTHSRNQMCPPSRRIAFIKINKSRHKPYVADDASLSQESAADRRKKDIKEGASAYNDFILYNYGTVSERKKGSGSGNDY